ncbi:hypothetical protein ACFL3F_01215 [Planctomycetota bacterium]
MDHENTYRIQVRGEIDPRWSDRLGGMVITTDFPPGEKAVTTLEGTVRDQAALAGIMGTLHSLHLVVLSVSCLEDEDNETFDEA